MRAQRQQNERKETAKKAKDWKQKTLEQNVKRKMEQESQQKQQGSKQLPQQKGAQKGAQKGVKRKTDTESDGAPNKQQHPKSNIPGGTGEAPGSGFAFPRIEVDNGRTGGGMANGGHKGGKKPSKEQLLKTAEAKQKERSDAPEESKVRVLMRNNHTDRKNRGGVLTADSCLSCPPAAQGGW